MKLKDLHLLPKFRDSISHLYIEHCRVDRDAKAICFHTVDGTVPVPCANLGVLMLGPGVSITHAAIMSLADNGCLVIWCGEEGVRYYASGTGETRSARNTLYQARLWADNDTHLAVVRRMYEVRFDNPLPPNLTLRQIRGMEGNRVRCTYAEMSRSTGVPWTQRTYSRESWATADPINRALSAANSCLYGICHAGILSAGFSTSLGFIHTGKILSFVYDIADLYKTEVTIPIAFREASQDGPSLETRVRHAVRDHIATSKLMARIIDDIYNVLNIDESSIEESYADDPAKPSELWDPDDDAVAGGVNHSEEISP